jgi:K+-sensing histidine kinase KdpD
MEMRSSMRSYGAAVFASACTVIALVAVSPAINLTTVSLIFVLLVILVAMWGGRGPALSASVIALLSFDFFFIPPYHTLTIGSPQDWVAFAAFIITALTVGQLSSRAKERAAEAEGRRREVEELYRQLQAAFEEATEAESLRRSEALKTALLDAVTHDLRTPLTSIKASVTALLDASPQDSGPWKTSELDRELLMVINEESDRLNRFVEEMMSVARIEAGQLTLTQSPTAAEDIVNDAVERASGMIGHRQVEITIQEGLPLLVVDAASVAQALYEILENAAKYSPPNTSIRIKALRADAGMLEISVENEGAPVPPELRERVFEKFFRVPDRGRGPKGFGMGLAIARGIVEAHKGRVWMEGGSKRRGTVVRFTVPGAGE